jgi:hypothetical protein
MPEDQSEFTNQAAVAPPALVESLRRLDSQTVLVTPQTDELVLDRPRLHLARVRQLRGSMEGSETEAEADLALAAHTEESRRAGPSDFGSVLPPDPETARRRRWWHPLLLSGAVAFAAAAVASLILPESTFTQLTRSASSQGGIPPAVPLFMGSLALLAAWLVTRSK